MRQNCRDKKTGRFFFFPKFMGVVKIVMVVQYLLHILHIRLSFGIVHSIIIYSTISKITVRPREIGTGGTGVTSNHDNEAHRGSDSVFYSLI